MKLILRRSQSEERGLFGGHKGMVFHLQARVELTAAERSLIDRYKGSEHSILTYIRDLPGSQGPVPVTAGSLVTGQGFTCKDVLVLTNAEEGIKAGCQNFRTLLDVMASFGGEVTFDFGSDIVEGQQGATPANWYEDPQKESAYRYWDGAQWTEHTSGTASAPAPG